jgi:hypothetical protein
MKKLEGAKPDKQDMLNVMRIVEKRHGKHEAKRIFSKYTGAEDIAGEGFMEPLPDMIGYTQHSTECVSDAIQETLLYADGLREFTQPIVYNMTADQMEIRSKLALKYVEWPRYTAYFHYIQKRFRAHYDMLNYLRTHKVGAQKYYSEFDDVCLLNPLLERKRAISATAGVLALKKLKGEKTYADTGLATKIIFNTIEIILRWLNVPFQVVRRPAVNLDKAAGIVLGFKTGFLKADGTTYWRSTGHETAFIKMKGEWRYYDNEVGFIDASKKLVEDILNPENNIYVYLLKKMYFVKGGTYPRHVWKDGAWSTDISEVALGGRTRDGAILMRMDYTDINCIQALDTPYNKKLCKFDAAPADSAAAIQTVRKLIECIHANPDSNSTIFEDLYHFIADHVELLKADHELFASLVYTLPTVGTRPACTPMIHHWVYKIQSAIKGLIQDTYNWYELPILKDIELPPGVETPLEERAKMLVRRLEEEAVRELLEKGIDPEKAKEAEETEKKRAEELKKRAEERAEKRAAEVEANKARTPCAPGEVRDRKTHKCRPKTPPKPKLTPCPPGEVRNAKTRKCRPRLAKLTPCPPGKIRDKKTQKCRSPQRVRLHD